VRLTSADGGYVELWPEGYQLDGPSSDPLDDELNDEADLDDWLSISCRIRTADGGEWSFVQPCLTTEEANGLAVWFGQVAAGAVTTTPTAPGSTTEGLLAFTEPNLAFSLEHATVERVHVRVHFSHESMPPWKPNYAWPDYHAYFLVLDLSTADLRKAAERWHTEIQAFPTRTPPSSARRSARHLPGRGDS
jgi:hypothetical protein